MKMSKTQTQQVVEAMRQEGGYATLRRLNEIVDVSSWGTKTPAASVRRIVQKCPLFFKIQPGLWALEESRDKVLRHFDLKHDDKRSEEQFGHGYFQGLLVEIGKMRFQTTYVPPQDQNRRFIDKRLGDITDTTEMPRFTYDGLLKWARTVDVVWFNGRRMPSVFYEVEHTTDIKNSLSKFYELQDFNAGFYIVADASRRNEFEDKLHASMFAAIAKRVKFLDYKRVAEMHAGMTKVEAAGW